VCLLTNFHDPPREGNYRYEYGNAIKPAIVADYNRHTVHVDNADITTWPAVEHGSGQKNSFFTC